MTTHGRRILGTAGHIDHGKTELIHALTGQETDRLEEEKRRGISIELGFAHHEIDGTRFGVIDVPGHERFLRHMLAGAQGIDLVLLVVAADDGVMPQTEEHFDIVHLLGVERLLVVITKSDLVPPARLDEVREEVEILTAGTHFESASVRVVSARKGSGIEELRAEITRELGALPPHPTSGPFRMPIDRSFVLHGHGVVVTGTASSGEVKVGDTLFLRPSGEEVRARTVQVHGESVEDAAAGQRVAINLPGIETGDAPRGSWITARGVYATTDRFDCELEVRPGAARPLRSFDRIRLHIGTGEVHGKLILLGEEEVVAPKQRAFCQIALDEEVLAGHGDRFVIRLETSGRTAGGGRVLHPFVARHKAREKRVAECLTRLAGGHACELVVPFLDLHSGFAAPIKLVAQGLLLTEDELAEEIPDLEGIVALPNVHEVTALTTKAKWQDLKGLVNAALANYHRVHPMDPGMDLESLRSRLRVSVPPKLFRSVIEILEKEKIVRRDESTIRLPLHEVRVEESDTAVLLRLSGAITDGGFAPPDARQLADSLGLPASRVKELLKVLLDRGDILRVSGDIHFECEALQRATTLLKDRLARQPEITVAEFRTEISASRKYALALLDYFDQQALTIRVGDARRLR